MENANFSMFLHVFWAVPLNTKNGEVAPRLFSRFWLSFKSLRNQITSIRVVFAEIADLSLGASQLRIRFLHKLPVLATQIPGRGVTAFECAPPDFGTVAAPLLLALNQSA